LKVITTGVQLIGVQCPYETSTCSQQPYNHLQTKNKVIISWSASLFLGYSNSHFQDIAVVVARHPSCNSPIPSNLCDSVCAHIETHTTHL